MGIGEDLKRVSFFIILFLLILPAAYGSQQTFSFKMQNNTGLNFENGVFFLEVVEINPPYYVKVNMTSGSSSKLANLFDSEPQITFNQVKVNSSLINLRDATITLEFPGAWGSPKSYNVVPPVVPVGIPNLVITKSADKTTLNPGDVVSITIKVENNGNATAYNLSLIERLPAGFSAAAGSRFPPYLQDKLDVGASMELYYALKAVDPGTRIIEPTVINYGAKTSKSGQITVTVAELIQERSNLTTVITIDKNYVYTDEPIKVDVRITNTGKASAKSVLIDGTRPLGTTTVEGDLRQVYDTISPGEQKEYRVVLKAEEEGNFSISLRTVYSDDSIGSSTTSDMITVTRKEGNNLYIIVPVFFIIIGIVIFTIKRHKEYSY